MGLKPKMIFGHEISHTACYSASNREYADLLDIFHDTPAIREAIKTLFPPDGSITVPSLGMTLQYMVSGDYCGEFVVDVFPGGAADRAGLHPGDFFHQNGLLLLWEIANEKNIQLEVMRNPVRGSDQYLTLTPSLVNPTEEFLDYMTKSASVIERDGKRLGYVRIYSWAGQHYQDRLEELLQQEPLASADGVILDIRGGWGGASPQYLDLFDAPMPTLTQIPRDGEAFTWNPADDLPERTFYWRKPVVLLVDGGSRSGKEIIAYAFKKHGIGPVVGERTAGAVLAGRPFILSDGSLLYLAVADVLVDGERLEGVGVEPDIVVARDLPFSNGKDPQLDAAYDALAGEIREHRGPPTP